MKARQLSVHELVLCGCLMRWKNHVTVATEVGVGMWSWTLVADEKCEILVAVAEDYCVLGCDAT